MSRKTTIILTRSTDRQVEALAEAGFGRFSDIVRLAIDRLYRQEVQRKPEKPPARAGE